MAWVLRLVGTESDSVTRGVDLIELHRPSGLVDIANLGLTLPEASNCWRAFSRWWLPQVRDHKCVSRKEVLSLFW